MKTHFVVNVNFFVITLSLKFLFTGSVIADVSSFGFYLTVSMYVNLTSFNLTHKEIQMDGNSF